MRNFANDLNQITEQIRARTVSQIKNVLRQKAFEDNGIPLNAQAMIVNNSNNSPSAPASSLGGIKPPSADVTLNALNASNDNEVDVEGLGGGAADASRLDFDSTTT